MPKRKRYKDLSRFQQRRRRQKTGCTVNVTHAENEISQERCTDNIVENSNCLNNNDLSENVKEYRPDFYSNSKESDDEKLN